MKNTDKALPKAIIVEFVLCLLAFISLNCIETPLSPVAPTSDIKLEGISLFDQTKTFADFLTKDSTLTRNPDGTSSYIKSQSLAQQGIPPIKFQPEPSSQQVQVGLLGLFSIPVTTTNISLADMNLNPVDYPGAGSIGPGIPPPSPAIYYSRPGDSLNNSSEFNWAAINSGTLSLKFVNNLPLQMNFNRPIILRNNQFYPFVDTSVVAIFNVGLIDSFHTYQSTSDMAGKIMRGQMRFDSISFTTLERSTPFSLKKENGIGIQFSSDTLFVDSTSAVMTDHPVAAINDSVLVIDSLAVIQDAVFTKGLILLRLVNNLGVDVGVSFKIYEMKQGGASYSINRTIDANQTQDINLNFRDIYIQEDSLHRLGTTVKFSVGITTLDSRNIYKVVTKNDFVQAMLIPQDPLVVKSITGKIVPTEVPINTGASSGVNAKDFENFSGHVTFNGMALTLNLPMTGGFPTDYHLAFVGKNSKKNKIDSVVISSMPVNSNYPRIYPLVGTTTSIQLSDQNFNDFISRLIPDVPDSFFVRGYLIMDPPDIFAQTTAYSIYDTTQVYPSYNMNFPAAMGIKNGVIKEVVGFSKQEFPKDFSKSVKQVTLTFYFFNKLPFKLFFHANFLGNYDPITHKGDTLLYITPSDTIKAAAVDMNGITTTPTFSKASISLDGTQMVQFNKADSLYVRFDMSTTNNGQVVRVRDTDYIRIYAKGDIIYTMNKP